MYNPLSSTDIKKIAEIQLDNVKKRLLENNITLEVESGVVDYFAKEGFDEDFGARPLKRLVEEKLVDEIALRIIEGKINSGDTIMPKIINGKLELDK